MMISFAVAKLEEIKKGVHLPCGCIDFYYEGCIYGEKIDNYD